MFSFFSKKARVTDVDWIGADIHNHILPGVDDGSPDLETSINFLKEFENLGFSTVICTPHIYKSIHPNDSETILSAKMKLDQEIKRTKLSLNLDFGAEHMMDQDFVCESGLVSLPLNYLLVEMPYLTETPGVGQILFNLQIMGYKPILAHPERYTSYFKNKSRLKRFKEKGCLMQLNVLSILGYYGKDVKYLAEQLLKENLYDFVGTDLHHERHLSAFKDGVESGKLYNLIGKYGFKNKEIFGSASWAAR